MSFLKNAHTLVHHVFQVLMNHVYERVFAKIALCRIAALGGHEEACDNCGTIRYSRASHMGAEPLTSSAYPLSRPGCWILPGWPVEKHQFLYPSGCHH